MVVEIIIGLVIGVLSGFFIYKYTQPKVVPPIDNAYDKITGASGWGLRADGYWQPPLNWTITYLVPGSDKAGEFFTEKTETVYASDSVFTAIKQFAASHVTDGAFITKVDLITPINNG